jgi:hypothetical protein
MSRDIKYIGMDVHKEAVVIVVLNSSGKLVMVSDLQPGPEPGDEPDQSSVSRVEHPLCRYSGVIRVIGNSGYRRSSMRACAGVPSYSINS